MPLYEYECQACHRRVEKIQKFSDAPLTTCPHCGGTLERTLTAPAVQFKGSGWYKDLYSSAKPASAQTSSGETASTSGGEKGASSGSADKPAAAPAAPSATSSPAPAPASGSSNS